MFHVVLTLASRFLFLGNVLQGFARGILALRNLRTISSFLIPALPPPPSIPLLDDPAAIAAQLQDEIVSDLPFASAASADLIAIESQSPVFVSSISSYQSSLVLVTPSQLPDIVPILVLLAVISGFLVFLPEIVCLFTTIAKIPSAVKYASRSFFFKLFEIISYLIPDYVPAVLVPVYLFLSLSFVLLSWRGPPAFGPIYTLIWIVFIPVNNTEAAKALVTFFEECGIFTPQDSRTPPIIDAIFEQITFNTASNEIIFGNGILSNEPNKIQVISDPSITLSQPPAQPSPQHEQTHRRRTAKGNRKKKKKTRAPKAEENKLELQGTGPGFDDPRNTPRPQPNDLPIREKKLPADLHSAEKERERSKSLTSVLQMSDKTQQTEDTLLDAKVRSAEADAMEAKLRADLNAAMERAHVAEEQLKGEVKLVSSKDRVIQSLAEESQAVHTRLTEAEATASKLRTDLKTSTNRTRCLEEQLYNQTQRVSSKERIIRAITEESRAAQIKLKEAEATSSELRADLDTAMDRARVVEGRLYKLYSRSTRAESGLIAASRCRDRRIRSITDESRMARTKLKEAEGEIARLEAELRQGRDRWLDERVKMRDCHEAEIHRLAQGARDAQKMLGALRGVEARIRARRPPFLSPVHSPCYQAPRTEPVDTAQPPPPHPPELLDTGGGTSSAYPAIEPLSSPTSSPDPSTRDWGGDSTRRAHYLLEISACLDQVSDVAKGQRDVLEGLLLRICELESEEDRRRRLEEELTSTTKRLRIYEDGFLALRRHLDLSREATRTRELESRAQFEELQHELDKCQAQLREAESNLRETEDSRRSGEIKLVEVVEQFSVRSAEVEESRLKCWQATVLSATLQERINELEVEVTSLKSTHHFKASTALVSTCPMDIDFATVSHSDDLHLFGSMHVTAPSPFPFPPDILLSPSSCSSMTPNIITCDDEDSPILDIDSISTSVQDSTLPRSSSEASDISFIIDDRDVSIPGGVDFGNTNDESTYWCLTDPVPPPWLSEIFSSERDGVGSMDWPPIGSTLAPEDGTCEQNDVIEVEENTGNCVVVQRTLLSPVQEITSDRSPILSPLFSPELCPSQGDLITPDDPETTLDAPHGGASLHPDATISTSSAIPGQPLALPSRLDISDTQPPFLPNFVLPPRFSLSELRPTAIKELFEPCTAPPLPRYDDGDVLMTNLPPDSLRSGLLSGVERDLHPTGTLHAASREAVSSSAGAAHFAIRTEDERRAMLDHEYTLNIFSLPAHPLLGPFNGKPSILDPREVKRPSELFSTLDPNTCRIQQGSLPSTIPTHADRDARGGIAAGVPEHRESALKSQNSGYGTDFKHEDVAMESCGETVALQSGEVVTLQSDVGPTGSRDNTLLPAEGHTSPAGGCTSGLPSPEARETLLVDSASACEQKSREDRRPNRRRVYSSPRNIPKLDYGLPKGFVPNRGRVTREGPGRGTMNTVSGPDTVFIVPPDGPTKAQAPLGTRRRYLKKRSTGPKAASITGLVNVASE